MAFSPDNNFLNVLVNGEEVVHETYRRGILIDTAGEKGNSYVGISIDYKGGYKYQKCEDWE